MLIASDMHDREYDPVHQTFFTSSDIKRAHITPAGSELGLCLLMYFLVGLL